MKTVSGILFFSVLGGAILLQILTHRRLEAEIRVLSGRVDQERRWAVRKAGPKELKALRESEAAIFRSRGKGVAATTASLFSPATGSVFSPRLFSSSSLKPRTAWEDMGHATPEAAFETWQWALDRADSAAFLSTIQLSAAAKMKADQFFHGLSAPDQTKYGSPEAVIAMGALASPSGEVGVQVIGLTSDAAGSVTVHAEWQYDSGMIRDNDVVFVQTADGWRQSISDEIITRELNWISHQGTPEK